MDKKNTETVNRNSANELKAYLDSLPSGRALDFPDETRLIEQAPTAVLNGYTARFPFSEKAELLFVKTRNLPEIRFYINRYGLKPLAQRALFDENMKEIAFEFLNLRRFDDVEDLIKNASSVVLHGYVRLYPLESDEQVLELLNNDNEQLFATYVNKGRFISDEVLRAIIRDNKTHAFKAVMYRFYRWFKKKCAGSKDFFVSKTEKVWAECLSEELQVEVLQSYSSDMIDVLLKTCPLAPKAQSFLFESRFDAYLLKLHVCSLYGTGGYRFLPEFEAKLFKALALKGLDDCLTEFRHRDDTVFVQNASAKAVLEYIKHFWLSDEAQCALFRRGEGVLMKTLISRYSPEHGLCWQAEVVLVEMASFEIIRQYVSFHTMCHEALVKLKERSEDEVKYYYSVHPW